MNLQNQGAKNFMKKFSMYMKDEEIKELEEYRIRWMNILGVKVSRNAFIRKVLKDFLKNGTDVEVAPIFKSPTNADLSNIIAEPAI